MAVSVPAALGTLPLEILLEIYHQLDIGSIDKLSRVNRHFWGLLQHRKALILLPVLIRDFSPFDELVRIHAASPADLEDPTERYQPRSFIFKRFPGDRGIHLTQEVKPTTTMLQCEEDQGFRQVFHGRTQHHSAVVAETAILTEKDLDAILDTCRTVQWWEEIFPSMRWNYEPENCRSLRPHEKFRLRKALYRFWLYGKYFHGDFPRPHVGLPSPFIRDVRLSFMRYLPSSELMELMDFVEVVKDLILYYIYPRLDPNYHKVGFVVPPKARTSRKGSMSNGFINQTYWSRIVKTYVKLGPEQLKHYYENICSYPRRRLVSDILLRHPDFSADQESIQCVMRCILDERDWLGNPPPFPDDRVGGIIDFDDKRDEERGVLGGDASLDGLPPRGRLEVSLSRYSPRGDDGWDLASNLLYQVEMEEHMGPEWMSARQSATCVWGEALDSS